MKKVLLGNLEHETPAVKVENGSKKQGRGMLCFFLMAFFALFLGGEAWAADPLVDGNLYLISSRFWTNYYLYPVGNNNYLKITSTIDKDRYWLTEKVDVEGETFYKFKEYSFDESTMQAGSSTKGIYYLDNDNNLGSIPSKDAIKFGTLTNDNSSLFKVVEVNGSYAVIPYEYWTHNSGNNGYNKVSWYVNEFKATSTPPTSETVGLKNYNNNNKALWRFELVGPPAPRIELGGLNISGPTLITQGNTSYEFTRGSAQSYLFFGSHIYAILEDNGGNSTTSYSLSYGPLPEGTTCSPDNGKWTLSVGNLPTSLVTITLICTVTKHHVNTDVQKVFSFPVILGEPHSIYNLSEIEDPNGCYFLAADIDNAGGHTTISNFTGFFDGQHHTIKGLHAPLFGTMTNAVVRNVNLENVAINGTGNTGSIANVADGASRIYNVGILSGSVGGTGNTGGLVGLLDGTARVINCFSFANITSGGQNDTYVGGLVGNNSQTSTQLDLKTIVVNCMFYGDIDTIACSRFAPVYGNKAIENDHDNGINPYCFFSQKKGTFAEKYNNTSEGYSIDDYNRSWPVKEEYLTRFEYYRSILNSNRRLMAWWATGNIADTALIDKWVVDPSIAPYPILKKWGKYPSIINPDPYNVWDPANGGHWVQRTAAVPYRGKKLGDLTVTIKTGAHPGTVGQSVINNESRTLVITDMDTTSYDYCYGKVQLPYYNDVFGNPSSVDHTTRYHGNYTDSVVTAWKITAVTTDGSVQTYNEFVKNWETGYNYADRYCIDKDIYSENDGRAFAQGGYYYVPEGVTGITIEAYWGKAFYLQAKDNYLDRVEVSKTANYGSPFIPAGTLPTTFTYYNSQSINVYNEFDAVMTDIKTNKTCNVYDQALVLLSNFPLHAEGDFTNSINNSLNKVGQGGVTMMSADFDLDNEPDFCFPFQWRVADNYSRWPIMPFRFDFLPIPELGMAMRHDKYAYSIGIFVPTGHFEITETAFLYTTQYEYMSSWEHKKHNQPLILNGGQYEQIVCHGESGSPTVDYTRNIIMGGHIWMRRFTPGSHTQRHCYVRHCAVSVMGGEFSEFYLTGIYWGGADLSHASNDNPHCYTLGGRFGIMAGAGMEAVRKSVYFEIDHSIIREFYGGGINANNPVNDTINVTINNSLVLEKYCGGPKIGNSKAVFTNATGTTFNKYYGGGNGGTNLYRLEIADKTPDHMPSESEWRNANGDYKYNNFKPISDYNTNVTYNSDYGYHCEYEFEVFNQSNGLSEHTVARTYYHFAQFGTTGTDSIINNLTDCTVKDNFYGGGNLGNVNGSVTSTLTDCTIEGNAFGGGYSADIPRFSVHDKDGVTFPYRDAAGVCHNGVVKYREDLVNNELKVREYTWCNKNAAGQVTPPGVVIPTSNVSVPNSSGNAKPAFQYLGKWYCYTNKSLENLGAISGNVTLTIKGKSSVGTFENGVLKKNTGNVYGGGDMSTVGGKTLVKILDRTKVLGNIYGGGNRGQVDGDTKVIINGEVPETPSSSATPGNNN